MSKIKTAIFPVGGLGTRFLPATKSMPKEMLPVVDKPIIQYAYEEAVAAGIERFIFVTGRNKNAISNHFDRAYELESVLGAHDKQVELAKATSWMPQTGSMMFVRQREALGLGHAVWCARQWVGDEPFAVILADDMVLSDTPCMQQMVEAYRGGNMMAVVDVPRAQTSSYGILDIADPAHAASKLVPAKGLVEKPAPEVAPSTLSIIGRYILEPGIFDVLENQAPGKGGEIQLTDAINTLGKVTSMSGFRYDGVRYDCGNLPGFIAANVAYALQREDIGSEVRDTLKGMLSA